MDNYICYHLHTEDSLLDSCTNFKLYVDKAVALGQRAIAFTEHGNIYNWIEKKMYCDAKGIKYIHGCEIYLTEQLEPKIRDNYHTILLARNEDGRKELNLLVGMATNPDHFYYKPRLSFEEFFNISYNIIKISACLASPLRQYPGSLVRTDEMTDEEYQAEVTKKKKVFSDLLSAYDYYEIQPHVKSREQILYNQFLYKASQEYHKPLIAATDTHSLDEYKQQCRKILLLAKNITFTNEEEFDLTYKSYDELVEMFRQQGSLPMDVILDAINNTNVMADSIEDFQLDPTVKYPRLYPTQKEEELALRKRIVERLKYKLEHGIIKAENLDKYKANILEEMKVFKQIDMTGFMLFMSDLISWCWDNGIPTGFCRGSVGGSTVAFITDIIDLDPVVWNTVFSRFANIDRKEVGDIDVDLSPDQRELVYNHIIESFGQDKTAYILAIGTISDKGTIDEIGRALKIPLDEVANIKLEYTQCVDTINAAQTTLDALVQKEAKEEEINKAQESLNKANKNMETLQKVKYKELFYYFSGLNGTAISQSMHPAGIVVSPITLPDNFGTFWNDGKQILYINMEEIHDGAGLVKYDLLGLKNVEIIRKTCEYAGIPYPKSYTINWEDDKVWDDMITSPVGIFQFESASAAHMLKQFNPHKINDMSIVNAALRPSGASYRDRLLSGEINHNPSKLIDDLLADNNGYLIFQEDTIKFLQNICGMTGSEADNIRRAIGRKQKDRLEKALPQILSGYCEKSDKPRDVAEEEAKQFLQIIEDSANYQFGFNHSTGYSMIGYVCAYLRYYYPEEFIAAYLNCANNDDDIINGTALAKQKGVKINNIKFGESHADYSVDKKEHSLYKGIASIKYCNAKIAEELYELSKKHYNSFIDVLYDVSNTSVNSRQLEILTRLNYFSDFGGNKKLLDTIGTFSKMSARKQFKKADLEKLGVSDDLMKKYAGKETAKMYGDVDTVGLVKEMVESIPDKSFDIISQIKSEKEYLGYIVYTNPNVNEQYYIILDYDDKERGKPNTPRFTAYNIHNGVSVKTRIKFSKDYIRHPFGEYSILQIPSFTPSFKSKKVDGKWVKTDEVEDILTDYVVIK